MRKYRLLILVFITCILGLKNYLQAQEDQIFHFVQIADTHLGIKEHNERTKKIIKSINKLPYKIEFVAHTGDIFSDNILNDEITEEGLDLFKKLKPPVYYLAGNHDILDEDFNKTLAKYKQLFSYTDTIIIVKGVKCLFTYTEPLADEKVDGAKEKLNWINENLKDNVPTIIFHHTPSVQDFYNNKIHNGWETETQKEWMEILNKYNIIAIIAGHFHRNQMHWLGRIPLYVAPSVAAFWERQATYRIYTYSKGKLSYETVYID